MKIESNNYTRDMINSLSPQRQNIKPEGAAVNPQKLAEKTSPIQSNKINKTVNTKQVNSIEINLNNLPQKLDEVLNSDEKAMLQELFPVNGSKWGVDAYKMSNSASKNFVLGNKLDLTT